MYYIFSTGSVHMPMMLSEHVLVRLLIASVNQNRWNNECYLSIIDTTSIWAHKK